MIILEGERTFLMTVDSMKSVNENTFVSDVIEKSKGVVIVDFLGTGVDQKALTPILESQAAKRSTLK